MTAEIEMNISMDELVQFMAKANSCDQLLRGNEYLALEPKVEGDEVVLKLIVSDEGHPSEWVGVNDIKKEWENCYK
jgi:hypothetical protein